MAGGPRPPHPGSPYSAKWGRGRAVRERAPSLRRHGGEFLGKMPKWQVQEKAEKCLPEEKLDSQAAGQEIRLQGGGRCPSRRRVCVGVATRVFVLLHA